MIAQNEVSVAFSGDIPKNYETYLGPLFFEPFAKVISSRIQQLRPASVLEVACGTGRVTKHLSEVLPKGVSIYATDINPAMVAYAQGTIGTTERIRWDVVDAVSLPYGNQQFDSIVSQFGVMFYSDRPKAYAEAMRVLKPGGVFVFITWDRLQNNPAAQLTDDTLRYFFPINTPAFYQIPFSYWNEHQIRMDLSEAGFAKISMEMLSLTGHADTAEMAAKGLLEGTPVFTAIKDRDEALLGPMQRALADDLTDMFGATNLKVPLQARLVIAVKNA